MTNFKHRINSGLARNVRMILKEGEILDRAARKLSNKVGELRTMHNRRKTWREDVPVFFVVGVPKSGTTWLMRTLDSHPEVLCRGEGRFFDRGMQRDRLKDMRTSEHIRNKVQPSSLYYALAESEYLRFWIERSVWTRDDDPEEHIRNLTRLAVNYFLTEKLAETGKKMVGDKTPLSGPNVIREVAEVYPDARVIHIIRDGRDTAVSRMHHNWNRATDKGGPHLFTPEELDKRDHYRQDPQSFLSSGESIFTERLIRQSAEIWESRTRAAHRDGPSLLKGNYAEVRYEDLLERPEEEFGRLFGFLGARADEKTVARCVKATSFERRTGRKRGQEDAGSGVRKGIAGDWANVFTGRDKEIYKDIAGDLLVDLGYERDDRW